MFPKIWLAGAWNWGQNEDIYFCRATYSLSHCTFLWRPSTYIRSHVVHNWPGLWISLRRGNKIGERESTFAKHCIHHQDNLSSYAVPSFFLPGRYFPTYAHVQQRYTRIFSPSLARIRKKTEINYSDQIMAEAVWYCISKSHVKTRKIRLRDRQSLINAEVIALLDTVDFTLS